MTASVADLLDRLHQQAFTIANLNTVPSPDRWRAQTVVWPKLAGATIRAIRDINAEEPADQVRLLIGSILDPIARKEWLPKASTDGGPNVPPDRRLVDMTRVMGGIADLLAHGMDGVDTDPGSILGLRANLLSPVMVAADRSLATAPVVARTQTPRRHLQLVSGIGAVFAVVPPELRPGPTTISRPYPTVRRAWTQRFTTGSTQPRTPWRFARDSPVPPSRRSQPT